MGSLGVRRQDLVRRLMEFSGERRAGPMGMIYGETMSLARRTFRFMLCFGVTVGAIGLTSWLLFGNQNCSEILAATEFAGTGPRFSDRYQGIGACDLDVMQGVIARDYLFSAVYAGALALFLTVWWNASWDTEPGFSRVRGSFFAGVALAAFVAEVIENTATLIGLHQRDGSVGLDHARIIFTVAWVKWMLVAILVAAMVSVLLVWLIRSAAVLYRRFRRSDEANHVPPIVRWEPDDERPNLGICLSGGGIRSAAFSLGAMSALEESAVGSPRPGRPPGLLGEADLLASVSGGGYAASSWRLAVGHGEDAIIDRPIIGDPNLHTGGPALSGVLDGSRSAGAGDLYPRLRDSRGYIGNGRGGLLLSVVLVVLQMIWHLFLTLAIIAILAWPLGRLIASWIISTPVDIDGEPGLSIEYWRLATPVLGLLIVLLAVLVVRSFTRRGRARDALNAASLAVVGLSGLLFVGLIVLPWLVVTVLPGADQLVPGSTGTNSALATFLAGGVVISVLRMFQAPIQSRAQYLGGVLLLVALLWFALIVASDAVTGDGLFGLGWFEWLAAVAGYIVVVMLTNPDIWSLHWLYRRRLAQSFANRWNTDEQRWEPMATSRQPPLSAYDGAPGPKQVICAVAARGEVTNTGIPVVSMTFEPDFVTIHCGPDPANPKASLSHAIATEHYEELFHGRMFAGRYRTVFCATALSAAAVAPSLGRHSLGTTNTLIAALNLRLGVWMPNPMFRRGRRAGPDLFNMFKEMTGGYELDDPNVYVTDGGHWENLALVELIRRRAKRIISVDASGDIGFSFAALHEAIELAQLECATEISFVDGGLDAMRPGDQIKAEKNWCRAEIRYPDDSIGRLLYVKAQASQQMPLDILRYSKEDPTFPNYSTADQLLREAEFCNLAILGRESMIAALDDCHQWLFEPFETGPVAPPPVEAIVPAAPAAMVAAAAMSAPAAMAAPVDEAAPAAMSAPVDQAVFDEAMSAEAVSAEPVEDLIDVIKTPDRRYMQQARSS